jgi:hypothetical protein
MTSEKTFEEFVEENLCIVLFMSYGRVSYRNGKLKFRRFEKNKNYIDYIDTYICDICNERNDNNTFNSLDDVIEHLKRHYNERIDKND